VDGEERESWRFKQRFIAWSCEESAMVRVVEGGEGAAERRGRGREKEEI
jgi:hypothetical protein